MRDCNNNGIGDATDIAGATSDDVNVNGIPDECDECTVDGDCDDGLFCNGAETCDTDTCVAGMNPCIGRVNPRRDRRRLRHQHRLQLQRRR
ncbi:MAG: hypothetical protein R3E58_20030 [Phycisphaerae bacterium]